MFKYKNIASQNALNLMQACEVEVVAKKVNLIRQETTVIADAQVQPTR